MKRVVPHFPLKQGSRGKPVVALKRAVSKATKGRALPWTGKFSPLWGPYFTRSFRKAQRLLKVPVTGVYDKATHAKLAPFYDAYALKHLLHAQKPPLTKEQKMRQAVLANLLFLYNHRYKTSYSQARAYRRIQNNGAIPPFADCSGSGAGACWGTDQVENFTNYSVWGYGNTYSFTAYMEAHGGKCKLTDLEIGDMVMYNGHVAWVVGWQHNSKVYPLVYSMGSYPARILPYNYRTDFVGYYKIRPK